MESNRTKTFKDIVYVMFSNIVALISSIINGFILPYILGATNYGYYRTFILYSTYTALLHCGLVDGILLKYGGITYNNLNKKKFRTITFVFIVFQLIISIVLSMSSIFVMNRFYSFLLITLGIYTFIFNIMTYYMFISQATMNFGILSVRNTIQSLLFILFTLIIYISYKCKIIKHVNYKAFVYMLIFGYFIILLWYLYTYRNITFGTRFSIFNGIRRVFKLCKIGIYLTIAYQVSNLLMVIDNQFVSMFFRTRIYGEYSFSYSIVTTALTVLGAVATVLLPNLKRDNINHIMAIYHYMISSIMLVIYFALLAYFPVCFLVKIILPGYIDSLAYLRIFAPELGITCSIIMITFNYYNAINKSKFYFYISVFILVISFIIDLYFYIGFHNPLLIAIGSLISVFIWYIVSNYFLIRWYHIEWIKNMSYMMIMILSFILSSIIHNLFVGFIVYFIIYIVISVVMFKHIIYKNVIMAKNSFM